MKFNKLSLLIGVALLPSWNVLADTIGQTLTFIPDNFASGALPTEDAITYHVTLPDYDTQTTIDVFNLNTPYATDVVISNLIAGTLYSYLVEKNILKFISIRSI